MASANREYKDRLFHFIFSEESYKDWALSLYNAVNHTHYTDTDLLTFNTIREVMYFGMHNDVSFLIDTADLYTEMNLYEEQSSFCPNMPLRKLQYTGDLYEKYLLENKRNKYVRTLIILPVPKLVTFYIGTDEQPDEQILRLSDSFPEGAESDMNLHPHAVFSAYAIA